MVSYGNPTETPRLISSAFHLSLPTAFCTMQGHCASPQAGAKGTPALPCNCPSLSPPHQTGVSLKTSLAHAQQMSLTAGRKQQSMRHTYRARATGSSRRNGERRLSKVARWSGCRPSAINQQSITYMPARRSAPLSPGGCRTTGHFPLCAPWLRQQCPLHSSISAALPCANGTALHDARRSAHRVCARAYQPQQQGSPSTPSGAPAAPPETGARPTSGKLA